jgi:eukaryotic-like serine/threonine-protein kinase
MSLPLPGTVLADKYRLEALLGEGGMGAVFRARHVLMDTPVAVKWLRPDVIHSADARERLLREARAVARIRHPHVVHVYDVDTHDGAPFIVMELLEGESFAELIARESLPIARVIEILIGAMKGCAAAHEHGVVHRDIKPENIFIARDRRHPDGAPKLIDFGVAKTLGNDFDGRITPTGHSVGTPIFMSVEQLMSTEAIDPRTDVYAFGVVLYRALTGRLPFDGDTFASIVIDIATKEAVAPKQLRPDLPASLDHVVRKAMARDRDQRYATIDELIAALRAAEHTFGNTPSSVYAAVLTPKPPPMSALQSDTDVAAEALFSGGSRARRPHLIVAAALLSIATLGWALLSGDDESKSTAARPPEVQQPATKPPPLPAGPRPEPRKEELPSNASRPTAAPMVGNQPKAPVAKPMRKVVKGAEPPAPLTPSPRPVAKEARPPLQRDVPAAKQVAPVARPVAPAGQQLPSAPAKKAGRSGGLTRDDF